MFEEHGFVRVDINETNREFGLQPGLKKVSKKILEKADAFYFSKIEKQIKKGKSVICDSGCHLRSLRDKVRTIANKYGIPTFVIYVPTTDEIVQKRWEENRKHPTRQDIRKDDFEKIVRTFEIPTPDEHVFIISNNEYNQKKIDTILAIITS